MVVSTSVLTRFSPVPSGLLCGLQLGRPACPGSLPLTSHRLVPALRVLLGGTKPSLSAVLLQSVTDEHLESERTSGKIGLSVRVNK